MAGGTPRKTQRRRHRNRRLPMSEINVTPFVDVMLVLLVIFMVAAPMMTSGVPINLPQASAAPLPRENQEPLIVTITADGRVFVSDRETTIAGLSDLVQANAGSQSDATVLMRADGDIAYSRVIEAMARLSAAGFADIGLVTDDNPTIHNQDPVQ